MVRVGCSFEYASSFDTPAVLMIRPEEHGQRLTREEWSTDPAIPYHDYVDLFGNRCRRLTIPAGRSTIRYDADVETSPDRAETDWEAREIPVQDLPDETLVFTLPSRFCLSDELSNFAWETFGGVRPGWTRVQAICDYVHDRINFKYGTSLPFTTVQDVLRDNTGVCRDFAHTAVTFCRALNIPARYAFGYLPDIGVPEVDVPMDFCAWFEAFLGGRWWTFDPRNNQRRIGHIPIARGRDALDVAMVTSYGPAQLEKMIVWADRVK
jgi:transglutaminase-like putative cysteine protease